MRPATKTMIELFGGTNGKGWGFFVVKRTKAKQVGPTFFQLHVPPDDVGYINPGE
jgi:hypothetical protein